MGIASDIVIIVVAALLGGLIAQRLGQPLIVGYILAGVVVGPYTGGVTVSNIEDIHLLAEIGVVLLLFTLGVHFSLSQLKPVAKVTIIGTPIQMGLTILWGLAIGVWLGLDWYSALWLGAAISVSSTMIIIKLLTERNLLGTLSSRVMVGFLIMQDILIVLLMLILPMLGATDGGGLTNLALAIGRVILFVGIMGLAGVRLIPLLMVYIARWNSRELFTITVLALALGIGYVSYLFGLSFAFGAFVAGLIISESDYSHQAISDMIPLRDVFSLLFFVSIGMLLNPAYLWANIGLVLLVTLLIIVGKGLIFGVTPWLFGYRGVIPIAMAFGMFQLAEFSFVVAQMALSSGAFSSELYSLVLAVALLTILLTAPMFQLIGPLDRLRKRRFGATNFKPFLVDDERLQDHVVIAGAGRVGQYVAGLLHGLDLSFITIDLNQHRVEQCKSKGFPVIFGDAAQHEVLQAAGVNRARLLLVTAPSISINLPIIHYVQKHHPQLHVVARAEGMAQVKELNAHGVHEVVQPEVEAALELARQALVHMDIPLSDIQRYLDAVRAEHYAPIYSVHADYALLSQLQHTFHLLDVGWVEVTEASWLVGNTIGDARVRARTGASIVAVMRQGQALPNPDAATRLQAGDMLAALGDAKQRDALRELAQGSTL